MSKDEKEKTCQSREGGGSPNAKGGDVIPTPSPNHKFGEEKTCRIMIMIGLWKMVSRNGKIMLKKWKG